jgi:outer membrane protein OmpA-like peptidoglycan-associated protein
MRYLGLKVSSWKKHLVSLVWPTLVVALLFISSSNTKAQMPVQALARATDSLSDSRQSNQNRQEDYRPVPYFQPLPIGLIVGATWDANLGYTHLNAFDNGAPCGTFTNGNATAPTLSIGAQLPLGASSFALIPEILYRSLSTSYSISPSTVNTWNPATEQTIAVTRQYTYDASLSMISGAMLLDYPLLNWLHFGAGPSAGILISHSYSEVGHYASPNGVVFQSTGSSSKTLASGTLSSNIFQAAIEASVRVALPMGSFTLWPQIAATIPLTNISTYSTSSWKTYTIGAGVSISSTIGSADKGEQDSIRPKAPAPTIVNHDAPTQPSIRPSTLRVSVSAVGIGKNGEEIPQPTLTVERVHVTEAFPTLNCVFFDDGSAQIPLRYHRYSNPDQTNVFDEKLLNKIDAMGVHHSVLDVIGSRLRHTAHATITLSGSRSGTSPLDANGPIDLPTSRAHMVAIYLERIWRIDSSRITIKSLRLPELPSDESTQAGQAENRRVEIEASQNDILAPLWAERSEYIASPPKLLFTPRVNHVIKSSKITVRQGDHILQTFDASSDGAAGEHLWTLDEKSTPTGRDSLTYTYEATDTLGNTASATGVIPLRREERDTTHYTSELKSGHRIERYSLILFDYSSSEFGTRQADVMIDTIARSIDAAAEVSLTGHTDQTGDAAYNDKLSGMRAKTAADKLQQRISQIHHQAHILSVEGHGARDVLFDNRLPEGRFLSRTVRITIEHGH